jgi:hypothetical protein
LQAALSTRKLEQTSSSDYILRTRILSCPRNGFEQGFYYGCDRKEVGDPGGGEEGEKIDIQIHG